MTSVLSFKMVHLPHQQDSDKVLKCVNYVDDFKDWPPHSPYLNPIRNLWHLMRKHSKDTDIRTLPKLKAAMKVWKEIPNDLLHSLVDSVPCRLQAVKNKGDTNKY